jgi:hypothetical protein
MVGRFYRSAGNKLESYQDFHPEKNKRESPHFLDVLEALDLYEPESRDVQLSCSVWVDLNVQLLSILTQQVSGDRTGSYCQFIATLT